jgi:hypothetical protein
MNRLIYLALALWAVGAVVILSSVVVTLLVLP